MEALLFIFSRVQADSQIASMRLCRYCVSHGGISNDICVTFLFVSCFSNLILNRSWIESNRIGYSLAQSSRRKTSQCSSNDRTGTFFFLHRCKCSVLLAMTVSCALSQLWDTALVTAWPFYTPVMQQINLANLLRLLWITCLCVSLNIWELR